MHFLMHVQMNSRGEIAVLGFVVRGDNVSWRPPRSQYSQRSQYWRGAVGDV
jgi:hypothetical protein